MSALSKKYNFDMVFDCQEVFRLILDASANPSRAVDLGKFAEKLYGTHAVCLAVAFTLLDNEVSFHISGAQNLSDEIKSYTLAVEASIESADFVFVCRPEKLESAVQAVKCGTLLNPHKSATVIIIDDERPIFPLTLSGPGINGCPEIFMSQTMKDAISLRDAQHYEYPQGIDLLFISGSGKLTAIPRLTKVEVA